MTRLVVHPAADLGYGSFVLDGLARVVGASSIVYSTEGFPGIFQAPRDLAFYLADDPSARCFLSLHDHPRPNEHGMKWAKVCGMVNVEEKDVGSGGKVFPIGPTFGIHLQSRTLTARHLYHSGRYRGARHALESARSALNHQRRRVAIDRYVPRPSDSDYAFYMAWPWAKHAEVNPPRERFIEACRRAPGLTFEGGFAPRRRSDVSEVLALTASHRYPIREYLDRVGRSVVAFSNPAVHGCLGWKLGEFLALGKAIVTLPLGRALPEPLEHGVHVHIVDGSPESLDDALERLRGDHVYRRALEVNARSWYDRNLEPVGVASRILAKLD